MSLLRRVTFRITFDRLQSLKFAKPDAGLKRGMFRPSKEAIVFRKSLPHFPTFGVPTVYFIMSSIFFLQNRHETESALEIHQCTPQNFKSSTKKVARAEKAPLHAPHDVLGDKLIQVR